MPTIPLDDDDIRNPNRRPGDSALSDDDRDWAERERARSAKQAEESAARQERMAAFSPPKLGSRPVVPVMGEDIGGGLYERRTAPDEDDPIRNAAPFSPSVWRDEYANPAAPEGGGDFGMGSGGPFVPAGEGKRLSEADVIDIRKRYEERKAAQQSAADRSRLMEGVNPEQSAKALELAERTGRTRLEVQQDIPGFTAIDMADRLDRLRASAPKLRSWLDQTPDNFDLAHDDTENLEWWDQIGQGFGSIDFERTARLKAERGLRDGAGMGALTDYALQPDTLNPIVPTADGVGAVTSAIGGALSSGFATTTSGIYGMARSASELNDQFASWVAGRKLESVPSQWLAERQEAAKASADAWMPKVDDPTLQGALQGIHSLPTSALTIATALMTGGQSVLVGAGVAGGVTAGDEYGTAREQGMTPLASAGYGLAQGSLETIFEIPQLKFLVGDLTKQTPFGQMLFKQALVQGLTEQGATHTQDFVAWAMLPSNKGKTIDDYIAERPAAAYQTLIASMVGTGVQTSTAKLFDEGLKAVDAGYRQKRAEDMARLLDKALDTGANSKLLKRSPDKYREAVAATNDAAVRVDSEAFNELAQSSGVPVEQLAQAFRIDPAQAQSAIDGGQDVVIPAGNYVAGIQTAKKEIGLGGEAIHTALGPNIRMNELDPTPREVEAELAIAERMQAQQEEPGFADAADRVREASRKNLAAAQRYNAETTSILSRPMAEMIITMAENTNSDPEVLWKEYAAKVENSLKTEEGELAQGGDRAPVEVDDATLQRAAEKLSEYDFAIWKAATLEGRSNSDIADDPNIEELRLKQHVTRGDKDAMPGRESVAVVLSRARAKGFVVPEAQRGRGDAIKDDVKRLVKLGLTSKQIHERLGRPPELRNSTNAQVSKIKKEMRERGEVLAQEQRGGFTGMNLSQEAVIRLYESANLSTFVHETAHWYLTTLEKMARLENPHPFVIEQLAAIRNWAGKHPEFELYDANGQITEQGVEVQESFAETFEAYLREGKAPSTAMRSVFAAFKSWLLRVYKSIVDIGGRVRLNAEITSVFDRALATDEAIAAVRKGMDQNAEQMAKAMLDKGVITQRQYERTKARLLEAKEKAEADLMARLMEQYERNQKTWWREEERETRRDVASEIDEQPAMRAYSWLAGEGWRDTLEDHVERAAQEQMELAQEQGLFETNATDDTLKLLQMRAVEAGLGPLILLFKTTSGRIIAFPGENGTLHHDMARQMFGLGDLKMQHGMYNPRKWPTIEAMNAAGASAWYDTTGTEADTEVRELAHRTYKQERAREEVRQTLAFLKENPEYAKGPLSQIMDAVEVSANAADRGRRLFRRGGELGQGEAGAIVYRGSAEDDASGIETGRLGSGLYSAEDPEIGAEWGGATGKVEAYRISGKLFDLTEETAQGIENYQKQEDTPAAQKLFARLKAEGYVGIRDPWSGHINVFDAKDMVRAPDLDTELGDTWTNDPELAQTKFDLSTPQQRAMWVNSQTVNEVVPGETADSRQYGFMLDGNIGVVMSVAMDPSGAAMVEWTFLDRLMDKDAPYAKGDEVLGPAEIKALLVRVIAVLEADMTAYQRDAYVFTPASDAHAKIYGRLFRLMGGNTYSALEQDGDVYLVHPEADIDANGEVLPAPQNEGRQIEWDDGRDAEARADAFYAKVRSLVQAPVGGSGTGAGRAGSGTQGQGELAQTKTRVGRTSPPSNISPMRLDLRAVEEQYGPEALAALPPKVRAYSAQATDADQFVELARDISQTLKKKPPRSLWKFLSLKRTIGEGNDKISYSGIRDPDGEILAMIGKRNEARGLIATEKDGAKSRSYSYEEAAHAAWEEGYFNGESPPSIAEFLDALRADFDGTARLYRSVDQGLVQQIDNANEWANWFDQNEIDINEENDAVLRSVIETKLSSQTENAIGPDEAAPFFKMADGRALLEGIKAGPMRDKLIREETRRRMIAKHGDIFNDGTIAQEAAAYAQNEVQQRQYEIELEALSNASGKQAAANLARETARETLRDKQVREVLNYNQWLILSERWGKKALEAAEKGDFAKAADFKRYQLINTAMFREARKLAETVEKARKHLLAYGDKSKQTRLLAAGKDYQEQMNGLLDDYQFRPESRKAENKRQARGEWIRAQMASIDPYSAYQDATKTDAEKQVEAAEALERSQMLAGLAEGTEAKNFKSITVDELLSVRDEADMIWRLATLKDRLIKEGERRRLSLAAGDIAAEIEANQPNEKPPEPIETDSPGYKAKRSVLKYFAMHRTLQSWARQFAGDKDNGVFWRYVVRPLNEAFARLSSIRKQMGTEVDTLFSVYTKDEQRRMFRDRQTFDFRQSGGPRLTLSKQGRLAFALNWGNAKNRQRLMDSLGLEVSHVQQVLNTLEKRDWDFVQASWDYLDTWFPEANRVHESVHGAPMDKEAPLEIATRFGIYRGGYYPIKFDPMLSSKTGQRKMEADAKTFTGQVGARSQPGFTKSRVKGKVTLPLRLSVLDVITSHLDQVAVSIATEEALFDAGRLIKQPAVENAIIGRHGREAYNTIVNTLVTAKFGLEGASGILAHLRNGATVVGLGWKVSTALLQPLGISNSIVRVGGFWIAKGYARMGKDAATIQSSANWIMERSEFMRNRRQSNSPEMQALRGKLKAGVTDIRIPGVALTKGAIDAVKNSAFAMMANTQFYSVDMPTWYGAYFKAQAAGMNEGDAVAEADQAVIDSQGGGELHQTAAMQTGAGTRYAAALRLLTNFMSYMITTYNLSVQRIRSARTAGQIAALGFDLAIMLALPVAGKMMLDAWTKGNGEDDEDELWERYIREQAAFLLSPFVGISQVAGSTRGDDSYGYRGPAGLGIFAEASRAGAAAAEGKFFTEEGEFDAAFWRPANKTAGMIFHYPASQIDASVRGALAYFNGETENPAAFLVGPPPAN